MTKDKAFSYCSPSRMWSFLSSKQKFLQNYVFKVKPPTTKAQQQGKDNHEFVYYALEKELKDLLVMPDFGSIRKDANTTSEKAKENKAKKLDWLNTNKEKAIVEQDQLQLFISLKALFAERPELKKALIEAKEKGNIEKLIYSDRLKIKGIPDFIGDVSIIDQKGDRKFEWLEKPELWFKYTERQKAMQAVFYKEIMEDNLKRKFDFFWLVFCNTHPYGVRIFSFDENYLKGLSDVCFYAQNCYLKQYLVFCEKVKDALGYDPFIQETYEGDAVSDWVKLNKLIDSEYLGLEGKVEVVKPSDYAIEELEREKAKAGLYEGV